MIFTRRLEVFLLFLGLACPLLLGCQNQTPPASEQVSSDGTSPNTGERQSANLPTTAIQQSGSNENAGALAIDPESAEGIVIQIIDLRRQPFANAKGADQIDAARRERNLKIVQLAETAIARSHDDPAKEPVLNEAVVLLMESRLELALGNDKKEIDALYDDAAALYERNPKSKAAAEAAFVAVRFAHANARRFAKTEPRWLVEFSRQARTFATNFQTEEVRAVPLLYHAGWSCELHGFMDEAVACYTQIQEQFPKTPQASQVAAVLRRLNLKGTPLQLAGPTFDGKFASIDDSRGKVTLVVFWAADSTGFREAVPALAGLAGHFSPNDFTMIGVNLDEDEKEVKSFVEQNSIRWPQIFFPEAEKRRWENPIVKYYGIRDIPMYWLVGRDGRVLETGVDPQKLEARLRTALDRTASQSTTP